MLLVLASVLTFTSCKKTKNELFKGYYSFKTSGVITVEKKTYDYDENLLSTEEFEMELPAENGQMNILSVDEDSGAMIVTMNIVGGGVAKYEATADKNTLTIDNQTRYLKTEGSNVFVPVKVSGIGKKYDNTVVFDLKYYCSLTRTSVDTSTSIYTIIDSDISCVARSND